MNGVDQRGQVRARDRVLAHVSRYNGYGKFSHVLGVNALTHSFAPSSFSPFLQRQASAAKRARHALQPNGIAKVTAPNASPQENSLLISVVFGAAMALTASFPVRRLTPLLTRSSAAP